MKKKKCILITIYAHPENYPPTLNAINALSEHFEKIVIVHRAHQKNAWRYPSNVELIPDGPIVSPRRQETLSIFGKIRLFLKFSYKFFKALRRFRPNTIIIYDTFPWLAWYFIKKIWYGNPILWYHNHDVLDPKQLRNYSVSWWALKAEKYFFPEIDIFTLPAKERKSCFPLEQFRGQFFFLPNLPSYDFYQPFYKKKVPPRKTLFLLYQGSISSDHGFEEIIPFLGKLSNSIWEVQLTLIGNISSAYQKSLLALAKNSGNIKRLKIKPSVPYRELPLETQHHHVGLAIHHNANNFNHATAGMASNKIYEYAAMGLPVLYYKSPHYQHHLKKYPWAFATDLTEASLGYCFNKIKENYLSLSQRAHYDFSNSLNFESNIRKVIPFLKKMRK